MEVTTSIGRDHPVDLKRVVLNRDGEATYEHLLTFVPVKFHSATVKICFLGRADVNIVREGARKWDPPENSKRLTGKFSNLAMTLKADDVIQVGTGLLALRLVTVGRGQVKFKATVLADGLLLNLEPLAGAHELSLRGILGMLDRGEDYRSDAL